jgi:hypothetical protein
VNKSSFDFTLKTFEAGDKFERTLSRDNLVKKYTITMGENKRDKYLKTTDFTDASKKNYDYWLRVDGE